MSGEAPVASQLAGFSDDDLRGALTARNLLRVRLAKVNDMIASLDRDDVSERAIIFAYSTAGTLRRDTLEERIARTKDFARVTGVLERVLKALKAEWEQEAEEMGVPL